MEALLDQIEVLREAYGTNVLVSFGALFVGILFGAVAEISRFCSRAAIAEWFQASAQGAKPRTLLLALVTLMALIATQGLYAAGLIDLNETIYWASSFRPLALIIGGLAFGVGMVLAGGCTSRLLVLGASGNGRSWVTLGVMAVAAYATLRGILSYPRIWLEGQWDTQITGAEMAETGAVITIIGAVLALMLVVLVVFLARKARFRENTGHFFAALGIVLALIGGWLATGVLGADDFDPVQLTSLTFVAPVAESLQYLMIFTGDSIRFSIALVGGLLLGAFASAIIGGRFAFVGFTGERDLLRYASGGLLMGFGGVTALGCTIGQGVTGLSTLAPASVLATASIFMGAAAMIYVQKARASSPVTAMTPAE